MLQLAEAGKRFGHKLLCQDANWLITPDERTALVGANGTGKSTLMKVLAGLDGLDYGNLQRTRGMSIGYLPQDGLALSGRTVFAECLSVFDELLAMEKELETLSTSLSELDPESAAYAAAADRFSHIDSRFRTHDGYALDAQVGSVLTGLGFSKEDWTRRRKSSPAAGRCASRSPSCCCKSPACCCSTSLRTILTSKPATGLRNISAPTPTATSSSRTIG